MEIFGLTHKGMVRKNNEDSFVYFEQGLNKLPNLAIVADGMGGHQAGEVASRFAIDFFMEYVENYDGDVSSYFEFMRDALCIANDKVYEKSIFNPEFFGMGTTFIACTVADGLVHIAHVGDSRLYEINEDSIKLLTVDHTYANEMVRAGVLSEEEGMNHPKRHALTKAIGIGRGVEADGYSLAYGEGSILLMCSDGLTEMIREAEILEIVNSSNKLCEVAEALISRANDYGGVDNITVILARVGGESL